MRMSGKRHESFAGRLRQDNSHRHHHDISLHAGGPAIAHGCMLSNPHSKSKNLMIRLHDPVYRLKATAVGCQLWALEDSAKPQDTKNSKWLKVKSFQTW